MKVNYKKVMTAIAATAMCAVTMACSLTANADNVLLKSGNAIRVEKEIEFVKKPIVTGRPVVTGLPVTKEIPNTYTFKIPVTFKNPVTFINPVTDPIGPGVDLKDHFYAVDPRIKTTTVTINR